MKFQTEIASSLDLYDMRGKITPAVYQRGEVWSLEKRKRLIDSILRGIDIPKMYFFRYPNGSVEIVDGNQRFGTLVAFFEDEFRAPSGYRFSELPRDEQKKIENHPFTIVNITEASQEDLSDLFIRLQLGVPTNAGEKLNALLGPMRDFVKKCARSQFMQNVSIPKRRFAKDQVCAQICLNSLRPFISRGFQDAKYEDLEELYRGKWDFKDDSIEAQRILSTFAELWKIFGERAGRIRNRAGIVSIYFLVEELTYTNKLDRDAVREFYLKFLNELDRQVDLGLDATNRTLVSYYNRVVQGADSRSSIEYRHSILKKLYWQFKASGKVGE